MTTERPWHFGLVTVLAVLWYAILALDYTVTMLAVPLWTDLFTEDQVAYFVTLPSWVTALWAIAVWVGLLGAIRMAGARHGTALLLAVAAIAMAVFMVWLTVLSAPVMQTVTGPAGVWIMLAITAGSVLFWLYARFLHAHGIIR